MDDKCLTIGCLAALISVPLNIYLFDVVDHQGAEIETLTHQVETLTYENDDLNQEVFRLSDMAAAYEEQKERADTYASILNELQEELDDFPEDYVGDYTEY